VQAILTGHLLPQINGALANLGTVGEAFSNVVTSADHFIDTDIETDFGDVSMFKAWLSGGRSLVSVLGAYDADVNIVKLTETEPLLASNLLATYTGLMTLSNAASLSTASNALLDALEFYLAGSDFILGETDEQSNDLIVVEAGDVAEEGEMRALARSLQDSMRGPVLIDRHRQDGFYEYVHLARFFVPAYVTRAHLPEFSQDNDPVAGTFPDPTFNGIFPYMNSYDLAERLGLFMEDADGDGLPDIWEWVYLGTTNDDGSGDPDGDLFGNYEEYFANTCPTNPDSMLFIEEPVDAGDGHVEIRWWSEPYRVYELQRGTNLLESFEILQGGILATPPVNTYRDPWPDGESRFYRVRVQGWVE
jgi:hypothetical protein